MHALSTSSSSMRPAAKIPIPRQSTSAHHAGILMLQCTCVGTSNRPAAAAQAAAASRRHQLQPAFGSAGQLAGHEGTLKSAGRWLAVGILEPLNQCKMMPKYIAAPACPVALIQYHSTSWRHDRTNTTRQFPRIQPSPGPAATPYIITTPLRSHNCTARPRATAPCHQ